MPFPVNCPNCGVDCTEKANAILRTTTIAPSPIAKPSPAPKPATTPIPHLGQSGGGIRPPTLSREKASSSAPVASSPPLAAMAAAAAAKPPKPVEKSNFVLGTIGAIVAGFVGMLGWYFLIKLTGYTIGYAAWGVGLLAGAGARVLSGDGSQKVGIIAGVCALLAIVGGQFLFVKLEVDKVIASTAAAEYDARVAYAHEAVNAQTDDEVKALLIKHEEIKQPTANDIKNFREKELPKLKQLNDGKPSRAEFEKLFRKIQDSWGFKLLILKESFSAMTVLFLFLGVSSAYKIGASKFGASVAD